MKKRKTTVRRPVKKQKACCGSILSQKVSPTVSFTVLFVFAVIALALLLTVFQMTG